MALYRPSPKGGKPYRVFKDEIMGEKINRKVARRLLMKIYREQKKARKKKKESR